MTRTVKCLALTVAGVLAIGATAGLQEEKRTADQEFLVQAFTGCYAQAKHSELAAKQATNAKVKEFAERVVKEHTKTAEQFVMFALAAKVGAVSGLAKPDQEFHDRLTKLKGEEFDRAYITQMIEQNEKAIRAFEKQAKEGTDAKLKEFAEKTLPTLRDHLKQAREVADQIKAK